MKSVPFCKSEEVLKFKRHYFLEEGLPQGLLPSLTNCGEFNHKAKQPLYIMRPTDSSRPPMKSLFHPFVRVILFSIYCVGSFYYQYPLCIV